MKISAINTVKLRNSTHFQFMTEIKDLIKVEDADKLNIKDQSAAFTAQWNKEDEALKRINKSALTQKIREADKLRDETFVGMCYLVKAMSMFFNPAIRDAAQRVQIVLNTYKKDVLNSLNSETSALYNLLQEFDLPKYTDDRINCNLNPWLNELKNRNEALDKLMKDRVKEDSLKTDVAMKDARREIDAVYREIEERINAFLVIEGAAKYESFVKQLNVLIAKYSVKHPHHRRLDEDGDGEDEIEDGYLDD